MDTPEIPNRTPAMQTRCYRCHKPLPEPRPPHLHSYAFQGIPIGVDVCSEPCREAQDAQWKADRQAWEDDARADDWGVL